MKFHFSNFRMLLRDTALLMIFMQPNNFVKLDLKASPGSMQYRFINLDNAAWRTYSLSTDNDTVFTTPDDTHWVLIIKPKKAN